MGILMRMLRRSWKGKRVAGKVIAVRHSFTLRARWYDDGEGSDIRLNLEDEEREKNHYPQSLNEAEALWNAFKSGDVDANATGW